MCPWLCPVLFGRRDEVEGWRKAVGHTKKYISEYLFCSIPHPPLPPSPLGADNRREMSHRQPRGPPHNLNNRRAAEDSTIPDTHLAEIYPQPIHEHGDQGQAQNQQTTINPLEFSPPQARSNPHIYPPRIGENRYVSHPENPFSVASEC